MLLRYACPLVSLQYSVLDPDTLKRLHRSKKQQIEMERLANKVNLVVVHFGYDRKRNDKMRMFYVRSCKEKKISLFKPVFISSHQTKNQLFMKDLRKRANLEEEDRKIKTNTAPREIIQAYAGSETRHTHPN